MCRSSERQAALLSQTRTLGVARSDTHPQVWTEVWDVWKEPAKPALFRPAQSPEKGVEGLAVRCYARPSFQLSKERPKRVEKPIELTAEGVWNEISGRLREALNENTFSTWFAEVDAVEITDAEFVLTTPNDFTREWIEGHFLGLIEAALMEVAGERSIRLQISEHAAKAAQAEPKLREQAPQP